MEKIKIGDIVKFGENGEELVGIIYENGNRGSFRAQTIDGAKHKDLDESLITEANPLEVKTFITQAGVPLAKATILKREAGECGLTVEEFENWTANGVKPQKWIDAENEAEKAWGGGGDEAEGEGDDD